MPDEAFADISLELSQQDRARRKKATIALTEWIKRHPDECVSKLVDLAIEGTEPEARERAVVMLRSLADADYNELGEGYCGVQMNQTSEMLDVPARGRLAAVVLLFVSADGPAGKAGLKVNDAIVSIDEMVWQKPDQQSDQLREVIRKKGAGKTVKIGVMRGDQYLEIAVKLVRRAPNLDKMNQNGAMLFMGGNIQPFGKIDQKQLDKLTDADRQGDAYFYEWLRRKKELRKDK